MSGPPDDDGVNTIPEALPEEERRSFASRALPVVLALLVLAVLIVAVAQIFTGCWVPWTSSMEHQVSIGYTEPPRFSASPQAVPVQGVSPLPGQDVPANPVAATPQSVAAGKGVYAEFCRLCHGDVAKGNGPVGALFAPPKPPILGEVTPPLSDGQIYDTITKGFGRMPPLASRMFREDRWDIVNYLRSVAPASAPQPPGSADPQVRAATLFQSACASCHGPTAEGGFAPALHPSSYLKHAAAADIAGLLNVGRKNQGMPGFARSLSPAQIDDLVALLKGIQTPQGLDVLRRVAEATTSTTAAVTTTSTGPGTTTTTGPATTTTSTGPGTTTTVGATTTTTTPSGGGTAAGLAVFTANCVGCHGADGAGGIGPKLKPNAFVGASTDAQVKATIEQGRPGTAMPAWQGRLSPGEIDAVVALLRSWQGGTPAGMTDSGATQEVSLPFNHKLMVGAGISCIFCHSGVRQGPAADVPPLELCAACHRALAAPTPSTPAIIQAFEKGVTPSWPSTVNEPDFVYFTHLSHVVTAKLPCAECHGDVAQMALVYPVKALNMGFCLGCHRSQDRPQLIDCDICHK